MNQDQYDDDPNADHGVYILIGDVNGMVGCKIGMSSYIQSRIYQVCQQSPFDMEHAFVLAANSRRQAVIGERALHGMLRKYRTRGEWFMFDPSDAKHKAALHTSINVVSAFHGMPKSTISLDELRRAVAVAQAVNRAERSEEMREAKLRGRQWAVVQRDKRIAAKADREARREQWEQDCKRQMDEMLARRTFAA